MAMVHKPGEPPGAGEYTCAMCGWRIEIAGFQVLPVCEACNSGENTRYFHVVKAVQRDVAHDDQDHEMQG
jgi:Zinc-ribbon containing domain